MSVHVPSPRPAANLSRSFIVGTLLKVVSMRPPERLAFLAGLPGTVLRAVLDEWRWQAHGGQQEPETDWRVWAIVAGRGFGKTRAGAEWVWARARENEHARIALVAATVDEAVRVMVEGESGLLAVARCDEVPRFFPSRNLVRFPGGAEAHIFSAETPDKLRGPQHHFAWCDELAKWPRAEATWDNLMLGLRLGERPRTVVTTTPKPIPLLRRILALPSCARTEGRTVENPHLPADFIAAMREQFDGTRLARQELEGELLENFEGAIWTRELIEKSRVPMKGETQTPSPSMGEGWGGGGLSGDSPRSIDSTPTLPSPIKGEGSPHECITFLRIVIGLDPPASTGGDSCGIVVCGKDRDGIVWVLADLTASGLSPEAWARRVAEAAEHWGRLYTGVPAKVVAEKNQGGDMIASVLRAVDADLPVRLVPATRSKAARAEPIALRFETGRAKLAGRFPELEDQLCALTWSGYRGAGSPDRADAMVWAMTDLFEKERAMPRVRRL
jgi:phage terminase large subunit-like protein